MITCYFYWPLCPIKIELEDSQIGLSKEELQKTTLEIDRELLQSFNLYVPIDRHQICIKNNNRVYLIHSDSGKFKFGDTVVNIMFASSDVARIPKNMKENAGAMSLVFNYFGNIQREEFYRELGEDYCQKLDSKKLRNFASSIIEYRHFSVETTEEFGTLEGGKLAMTRIVAGSYIDTSLSEAFVKPLRKYFFGTYVVLVLFFYTLYNVIFKIIPKKKKDAPK